MYSLTYEYLGDDLKTRMSAQFDKPGHSPDGSGLIRHFHGESTGRL